MSKETWLTENADGSVTVKFEKRPPKIDGTVVKSLQLREPLVEDELLAKKAGDAGDAEVVLIANLAEVAPEAIQKMTSRNYRRLMAGLELFYE